MPQLIAMVIVVVGAMIYMFQTFGGTGDKIEGIAQKSSVMTEINNIKNGIQLALRDEAIELSGGTSADKAKTLEGLAELQYFADQINDELNTDLTTADTVNKYKAISFGSGNTMEISLVLPSTTGPNVRPGLFIDLSQGSLASNAGFLEQQLATDLKSLASIDRKTELNTSVATLDAKGDISAAGATTGTETDGKFTIYFKDLQSGLIK